MSLSNTPKSLTGIPETQLKNLKKRPTKTLQEPYTISFLDSGAGGMMMMISVLKHLYPVLEFIHQKTGRNFKLSHVGDNANAPYGEKDYDSLKDLTENLLKFAFDILHSEKSLIACNTASVSYNKGLIDYFEDKKPGKDIYPIIEDSAKYIVDKAIKNRGNKSSPLNILVLATKYTRDNGDYQKQIEEYAKSKGEEVNFIIYSPENWVSNIEGKVEAEIILQDVKDEISKLVKENNLKGQEIHAVGLFCTHYPLLKRAILKRFENEGVVVKKAYSQGKLFAEILKDDLLKEFNLAPEDYKEFKDKLDKIDEKSRKKQIKHRISHPDENFLELESFFTGDKDTKDILGGLVDLIEHEYFDKNSAKPLAKKLLEIVLQDLSHIQTDLKTPPNRISKHSQEAVHVI